VLISNVLELMLIFKLQISINLAKKTALYKKP
jgi:hypothetical protein